MAEGDVIDSMESFARITSYYMVKGLGGSIDVTDVAVCEKLQQLFSGEAALGGTCAQGAAALAALGIPVNVCLTDRSEEVCSLLGSPEVTGIEGGRNWVPVRKMSSRRSGRLPHHSSTFQKGDLISVNGKEYEIPLSNRLTPGHGA